MRSLRIGGQKLAPAAHCGLLWASYGAEAGMREIVVPYFATVHSAYGSALSDVRFSMRHSDPLVLPADPARIITVRAVGYRFDG